MSRRHTGPFTDLLRAALKNASTGSLPRSLGGSSGVPPPENYLGICVTMGSRPTLLTTRC
jgi:hypothetical protein